MNKTQVTSIQLGFIADTCMRLNKIGLNHLQISGGHLRSWDHHRGIYIDVKLTLPADCDPEVFQLSIEATPKNAKLLRSVGKRGGNIKMERCGQACLFIDDYTQTKVSMIESTPVKGTVLYFVGTLQKLGSDIPEITGRGELSINGNEPFVLLGIYDEQFASLIFPGHSELFFEANVARQMKRKQRKLYKSYGFLKFGEPDFNVSVYKDHKGLWLLTCGQFADGIPYQVLERLTQFL